MYICNIFVFSRWQWANQTAVTFPRHRPRWVTVWYLPSLWYNKQSTLYKYNLSIRCYTRTHNKTWWPMEYRDISDYISELCQQLIPVSDVYIRKHDVVRYTWHMMTYGINDTWWCMVLMTHDDVRYKWHMMTYGIHDTWWCMVYMTHDDVWY